MSPCPAPPAPRAPVGPGDGARAPRAGGAPALLVGLLVTLLLALLTAAGSPAAAGTLTPSPSPQLPGTTVSPLPDAEEPAEDPAVDDESSTADQQPALPLALTLTTVTPSTLPAAGTGEQVTVSGLLLNRSLRPYEGIKVYPVLGTTPMTTSDELAEAADLPVDALIGSRNLDPANFADLGTVDPGETARFEVTIGADDVGITRSGVYWLAAQALGGVDGGRDAVADGRARTFVSLRGDDPESDPTGPRATARQVDVSLVIPVRESVRRGADGRLVDPEDWARRLRPDGRLGRLLAVGSETGITPSWLVDPAVVDAAVSMAEGNPAFPLTAEEAATAAAQPGSEPIASGTGALVGPLDPEAVFGRPGSSAARWLGDLGGALPEDEERLDLLPYAEPDVSAIARDQRRSLLRDATAATARSTARFGLDGRLLVAPPRGYLRPEVVALEGPLAPSVPVLLSARAVAGDPVPGVPLSTGAGHPVALFDPGVIDGGPAPGGDLSALGLRQRVLAEALVTLLGTASDTRPGAGRPALVAMPPARWDPGPQWRSADLLEGLDVPWISSTPLPGAELATGDPTEDPTPDAADDEADGPSGTPSADALPLPEATSGTGQDPALDDVLDSALANQDAQQVTLRYPRRQARRELSVALLATAADQVELARALGSVLVDSPDTGRRFVRAALTAVARSVRGREAPAAQRLAGQAVTALRALRQIRLEVPGLVTMSSSTGSVTVKIVNGLDQPVRVGLEAEVSSGTEAGALSLDVPEALDIPANQEVTLRLRARASRVGVNVVDLRAAAPTGRTVGLPSQVNVRASTLGIQIYRVMAVAGIVILALVVLRIRRRIRVRRATHGPLLSQELP